MAAVYQNSRTLRLCLSSHRILQQHLRSLSSQALTNTEVRRKRVELFDKEQQRQLALVTRVEKIQVKHVGLPESCTLVMNKNLSTPYNCAMHMKELIMNRSVLALVNGEPWDMHRPLVEDCELKLLHFEEEDPRVVNNAFWKTCSFILGHVLETALQDKYYVELCSFPPPNVTSGSFVYDADLKVGDWKFTQTELNCLSRIGHRLSFEDLKFQRLDIPVSVANDMFSDNRFKKQQIASIAEKSKSGSTITVYRVGDHIDMSSGPLISLTSQIGRYSVCAIHKIESPSFGKLQRVQGLALPAQLTLHSWTYDTILRPRAAKFNNGPIPDLKSRTTPRKQLTPSMTSHADIERERVNV